MKSSINNQELNFSFSLNGLLYIKALKDVNVINILNMSYVCGFFFFFVGTLHKLDL